jgi:Polyketide cyclase / dehydrase and lipid transport
MWQHEYAGETSAEPAAVWSVLRDLDNWASWDTSMDWVRLHGPFGVGAEVVMKPSGQDPISSVIVQADENERYADQTEFAGVTLRFSHTLVPLETGGTRVVHRLEITGPAAGQVGPELGPAITEDFPEAMAALLARAAS